MYNIISAFVSKSESGSELRSNNTNNIHAELDMLESCSKTYDQTVSVCAAPPCLRYAVLPCFCIRTCVPWFSSISSSNTEFVTRLLDVIIHVTTVSSDLQWNLWECRPNNIQHSLFVFYWYWSEHLNINHKTFLHDCLKPLFIGSISFHILSFAVSRNTKHSLTVGNIHPRHTHTHTHTHTTPPRIRQSKVFYSFS
jgi:hypothetical protein